MRSFYENKIKDHTQLRHDQKVQNEEERQRITENVHTLQRSADDHFATNQRYRVGLVNKNNTDVEETRASKQVAQLNQKEVYNNNYKKADASMWAQMH